MQAVATIPHLSLSVASLAESEAFYARLNARFGRRTPSWIDVWAFGLQLTLHQRPKAVVPSPQREAMHFGATVDWDAWPEWLALIELEGLPLAVPPQRNETTAKIYLSDPDGYIIEIKAYRDLKAQLNVPERT